MQGLVGLIFLVFWLSLILCMGFMWWKIVEKTGYHGALGILMLVPVANLVLIAILAFREWPVKKLSQGQEGKPSSGLPGALIAAIVIGAMVPIFLLFAAIAIPNFVKARMNANESSAKVTIRAISKAIEIYSETNNGQYPLSETDLNKQGYLSEEYNNTVKHGYAYSLNLNQNGYKITANPVHCASTGTKVFTFENNGDLSEQNCYMNK